jgi:hypothetical protein
MLIFRGNRAVRPLGDRHQKQRQPIQSRARRLSFEDSLEFTRKYGCAGTIGLLFAGG